jgi:hypothetical protein
MPSENRIAAGSSRILHMCSLRQTPAYLIGLDVHVLQLQLYFVTRNNSCADYHTADITLHCIFLVVFPEIFVAQRNCCVELQILMRTVFRMTSCRVVLKNVDNFIFVLKTVVKLIKFAPQFSVWILQYQIKIREVGSEILAAYFFFFSRG